MRVDFHSHCLPGVDHGCRNLESSLTVLRKAKKEGTGTVVATHHFFPGKDDLDNFLERRRTALDNVKSAAGEGEIPNIVLGAEVYLTTDIVGFDRLRELCIEDTDYILIEMPYDYWMPWVMDEIYKISEECNVIPIIAHIERYTPVRNNPDLIGLLSDMGAVIQVNTNSVFSPSSAKFVKSLLKKRKVHILGSDTHSSAEDCCFLKAFQQIEKKYGKAYVELIDRNSENILNNREIEKTERGWGYNLFKF